MDETIFGLPVTLVFPTFLVATGWLDMWLLGCKDHRLRIAGWVSGIGIMSTTAIYYNALTEQWMFIVGQVVWMILASRALVGEITRNESSMNASLTAARGAGVASRWLRRAARDAAYYACLCVFNVMQRIRR